MSRPTVAMTDSELERLLTRARLANSALGITGILFYSPHTIAQLLEGEHTVIEKLYQKIAADSRHAGIIKLADKEIRTRGFANWAMAFEPASAAGFQAVAGYLDPTQVPEQLENLTGADQLLYDLIRTTVLPQQV